MLLPKYRHRILKINLNKHDIFLYKKSYKSRYYFVILHWIILTIPKYKQNIMKFRFNSALVICSLGQ